MLDVAIIIVSWNVRRYLSDCLVSVFEELGRARLNGAVWVVDNGSTDGTLDLLHTLYPHVHLIANEENVGFGAANNQGMQAANEKTPRYYFLLNPDTVLRPGALGNLIAFMDERPEAGMAGARLVYGDGRFQHSAFAFPGITQLAFDLFPLPPRLYESRWNGRYPRHLYRPEQAPFAVDFPLGAAMLVRHDVAMATGGFDESFHMYCEEVDWCWRIWEAGWPIYTVPAAEVVHFGGESTSQVPARSIINLWQSRAQLYRKHHKSWRVNLAQKLVKLGLSRKARQAGEPLIKQAYRDGLSFWLE
ncbi:MAG: glycosyltransferase family 2 protein [Anaerolineales bacterium]|nr:glycosyltransferase family 2 protein [Anaerolineales bacterium]MCB0004850.1 glycosyltransferase family 2 protein [Anaerolineales bacterium]MCB0010351.1 glycosyltransferase family 2 protein [Anaerolineales bacterium]MCB8962425.1 glycosyltransferase family 2 protein [Ardenticatenales bacterium]